MRQDQIQRLKDLSERLADHFLLEADPVEWPGAGKAPTELTQQERGDAYWSKKNAMATGGVLRFTLDAIAKHSAPAGGGGEPSDTERDHDLDRAVNDAQRRSKELVDGAMARARRKPEFDKRVHGKG